MFFDLTLFVDKAGQRHSKSPTVFLSFLAIGDPVIKQ